MYANVLFPVLRKTGSHGGPRKTSFSANHGAANYGLSASARRQLMSSHDPADKLPIPAAAGRTARPSCYRAQQRVQQLSRQKERVQKSSLHPKFKSQQQLQDCYAKRMTRQVVSRSPHPLAVECLLMANSTWVFGILRLEISPAGFEGTSRVCVLDIKVYDGKNPQTTRVHKSEQANTAAEAIHRLSIARHLPVWTVPVACRGRR